MSQTIEEREKQCSKALRAVAEAILAERGVPQEQWDTWGAFSNMIDRAIFTTLKRYGFGGSTSEEASRNAVTLAKITAACLEKSRELIFEMFTAEERKVIAERTMKLILAKAQAERAQTTQVQ